MAVISSRARVKERRRGDPTGHSQTKGWRQDPTAHAQTKDDGRIPPRGRRGKWAVESSRPCVNKRTAVRSHCPRTQTKAGGVQSRVGGGIPLRTFKREDGGGIQPRRRVGGGIPLCTIKHEDGGGIQPRRHRGESAVGFHCAQLNEGTAVGSHRTRVKEGMAVGFNRGGIEESRQWDPTAEAQRRVGGGIQPRTRQQGDGGEISPRTHRGESAARSHRPRVNMGDSMDARGVVGNRCTGYSRETRQETTGESTRAREHRPEDRK
ncbi:hypothetical protein C8F04DRAFT_1195427 [Mycena alexandri]|uniref:Uncharacterized protein n=1 Tax=Mycena alexandri TaxID=1745969 RepID=A0AAD6WUJ4_9AGAR|nr:hypothetical protein C8F04DRAFT_1195427 [Mycena alexandri]